MVVSYLGTEHEKNAEEEKLLKQETSQDTVVQKNEMFNNNEHKEIIEQQPVITDAVVEHTTKTLTKYL